MEAAFRLGRLGEPCTSTLTQETFATRPARKSQSQKWSADLLADELIMKTIVPIHLTEADRAELIEKITDKIVAYRWTRGVDKSLGPCWLLDPEMWDDGKGFKKMKWRGRAAYVHRLSYEAHVGEIPDGLILDHLCRVRRCCSPKHLEPVTVKENTLRGNGALALLRSEVVWDYLAQKMQGV